MLRESAEDIFTCGYQTLTCPVNTVGVMGNGLALAFKLRVPGLYDRYRHYCLNGSFTRHRLFSYRHASIPFRTLCFPTKRHWRDPSNIDDVHTTLLRLREVRRSLQIESLALPALGCGKGALEWVDVRRCIRDVFYTVDYDVLMIPPH